MGNAFPKSNRSAKNKYKTVKNFSSIEDVDNVICELETSFRGLEMGIKEVKSNVVRSYQFLSERIKAIDAESETGAAAATAESPANLVDFLIEMLNQARENMLNEAKMEFNRLIDLSKQSSVSAEDRVKKIRDCLRVSRFEENKNAEEYSILNDLFRLNRFETFYKIKYMDLIRQELDMRLIGDNNVESELHIQILGNGKMFQFWKQNIYTGYMQIRNSSNEVEIERRIEIPAANALNYYVSFKSFDSRILCLTHVFNSSTFIIMDSNLEDTISVPNRFEFKVDLVLMNRYEILVRTRNTNRYINMNHKFEEVEIFRNFDEKLCKALFASNLESIFHMTPFELFVYSSDSYSIKTISRENGLTMNMFQIKNTNVKLIKADSDSRIVVKLNYPHNVIQLYTKRGELLIQHDFMFPQLYDSLEINSVDAIYFLSNNRRRLLMF